MPDILLKRQTIIMVADYDGTLFPRDDLYPKDDLYPAGDAREVTNIVAGSLKLDALIAENSIQFGQLYATKFEAQVYDEEDLTGKYIHVYQTNNGVPSDIFSGYIESCKLDKIGTDRTIVAYDLAYQIRQLNVADFWNSYWTNREASTIGHIRNALLDYYNIVHENVILPNDSFVIKKDVDFTSCSLQQLLRCICELNCCLPHIDRNGFMTFIVLNTESTPIDLTGKYEWTNSDFEDFVTEPVSGVQFFDSSDQLKYTIGSTENAYPIKKNIFLYDADTATLESVGNAILDYLQDLVYTPASLKMIVGSFDLHLGDYVHTEKGNFYILQNSYSGSQFVEQTIKAPGQQKSYSGTPTLDYGEIVLNERIARVAYDLEGFEAEFGEYKTEVSHEFDTIFSNYEGEYIPTTSNSPANTWTTDEIKAQHLNEVFFDSRETEKKYYRWVLENGVYKWKQLTVLSSKYDIVSSNLRLTDEMIATEVKRATQKEGDLASDLSDEQERAKLAEKLMFSNYNGKYVPTASNAPAKSWTTNALKQEHLKEVFCDTLSNKYYRWSYENGVYQWIEIPITTSSYQVAQSAIKQTADELTINMNKSFELSVANYNGAYKPTASEAPANTWTTTDLKNAHLGEVFYDSRASQKKYYRWVLDGSTYKWVLIETPNGIYDVTTSNLRYTTEELTSEISSSETRINDNITQSFANYIGTVVPTTSNAPANSWTTDALKLEHNGEIYYNKTNKKYYKWTVTFKTDGTINSANWQEQTINTAYDLVTSTANSKMQQTSNSFSVEINTEKTAREQADLAATYNYTGTTAPTNPWTDADRNHVGEIYYRSDTQQYYVFERTGTNTYEWVQTTVSRAFDLTTTSNTAKFDMAEDEILLEVSKSEKRLFANYTGSHTPTNNNYPASSWTTDALKKAHENEVYYNTATGKYYKYGLRKPDRIQIQLRYATESPYDYLNIIVPNTSNNTASVYKITGGDTSSQSSYSIKTIYFDIPDGNIYFKWHTDSSRSYYGYYFNTIRKVYRAGASTTDPDEIVTNPTYPSAPISFQSDSAHPYTNNQDIDFIAITSELPVYNVGYGWTEIATDDMPFSTVSSQIRQTAEEISLKVSKGDVISEINLSTDAIELTTAGRLIITAGNFQLDEYGNLTAENAELHGTVVSGGTTGGRTELVDGTVQFYLDDSWIGSITPGSYLGVSTFEIETENRFSLKINNTIAFDVNTDPYNSFSFNFEGTALFSSGITAESYAIQSGSDFYIGATEDVYVAGHTLHFAGGIFHGVD